MAATAAAAATTAGATALTGLLLESQREGGFSAKLAAAVRRAQRQDPSGFLDALQGHVRRCLLASKRETGVDEVLKVLVAACTAKDASEDTFLATPLLTHLLEFHASKDKLVRARVCAIVADVLAALPEDADIPDALWTALESAMLVRATDKLPAVRAEAVRALERLQTDSADCVVSERLHHILRFDPSKDVRAAAVHVLALTPDTLGRLVDRARDVAPEVRRATLESLGRKAHVSALPVDVRAQVLREGLRDREATVRHAATLLAATWFAQVDASVQAFVELFELEDHEDVVRTALRALFLLAAKPRAPTGWATWCVLALKAVAATEAQTAKQQKKKGAKKGAKKTATVVRDEDDDEEQETEEVVVEAAEWAEGVSGFASPRAAWAAVRKSLARNEPPAPTALTPERAIAWRARVEFLVESGAREALETLVPNLTALCGLLVSLTELDDGVGVGAGVDVSDAVCRTGAVAVTGATTTTTSATHATHASRVVDSDDEEQDGSASGGGGGGGRGAGSAVRLPSMTPEAPSRRSRSKRGALERKSNESDQSQTSERTREGDDDDDNDDVAAAAVAAAAGEEPSMTAPFTPGAPAATPVARTPGLLPTLDADGWLSFTPAFVARQALCIARHADLSDEVGRKRLVDLCLDLVAATHLPADLVPEVLATLLVAQHSFPEHVARVLDVLRHRLLAASSASEVTRRMHAMRVLHILLSNVGHVALGDRGALASAAHDLFHSLVIPAVVQDSVELRAAGVSTLGQWLVDAVLSAGVVAETVAATSLDAGAKVISATTTTTTTTPAATTTAVPVVVPFDVLPASVRDLLATYTPLLLHAQARDVAPVRTAALRALVDLVLLVAPARDLGDDGVAATAAAIPGATLPWTSADAFATLVLGWIEVALVGRTLTPDASTCSARCASVTDAFAFSFLTSSSSSSSSSSLASVSLRATALESVAKLLFAGRLVACDLATTAASLSSERPLSATAVALLLHAFADPDPVGAAAFAAAVEARIAAIEAKRRARLEDGLSDDEEEEEEATLGLWDEATAMDEVAEARSQEGRVRQLVGSLLMAWTMREGERGQETLADATALVVAAIGDALRTMEASTTATSTTKTTTSTRGRGKGKATEASVVAALASLSLTSSSSSSSSSSTPTMAESMVARATELLSLVEKLLEPLPKSMEGRVRRTVRASARSAAASAAKGRGRGKAKRGDEEEEEEDGDEDEEEVVAEDEEDEDDEEEEEEDEEEGARRSRGRRATKSSSSDAATATATAAAAVVAVVREPTERLIASLVAELVADPASPLAEVIATFLGRLVPDGARFTGARFAPVVRDLVHQLPIAIEAAASSSSSSAAAAVSTASSASSASSAEAEAAGGRRGRKAASTASTAARGNSSGGSGLHLSYAAGLERSLQAAVEGGAAGDEGTEGGVRVWLEEKGAARSAASSRRVQFEAALEHTPFL